MQKSGYIARLFRIKETKTEEYQEASFYVPAVEELINDITNSEDVSKAFKQIIEEIVNFIDNFLSQLQKIFSKGIAEYHNAIKNSVGEITELTRKRNEQLTRYLENIKTLVNNDVKALIEKEYDPHEKEI